MSSDNSRRDAEVGKRVREAENNENSGSRAERIAAISGRAGGKAAIRRGGTGRSQRELGHVKGGKRK
jgi:hypothetical protein